MVVVVVEVISTTLLYLCRYITVLHYCAWRTKERPVRSPHRHTLGSETMIPLLILRPAMCIYCGVSCGMVVVALVFACLRIGYEKTHESHLLRGDGEANVVSVHALFSSSCC